MNSCRGMPYGLGLSQRFSCVSFKSGLGLSHRSVASGFLRRIGPEFFFLFHRGNSNSLRFFFSTRYFMNACACRYSTLYYCTAVAHCCMYANQIEPNQSSQADQIGLRLRENGGPPLVSENVPQNPPQNGPQKIREARHLAQRGVRRQHLLPLERIHEALHVSLRAHLPVVKLCDLISYNACAKKKKEEQCVSYTSKYVRCDRHECVLRGRQVPEC